MSPKLLIIASLFGAHSLSRIILLAFLLGIALPVDKALAQGTVVFSNAGGFVTPLVYLCDLEGAVLGLAPGGNQYVVGLYYAPAGASDPNLFTLIGAPTGFLGEPGMPSGLFDGGTRTVPVSPPGGVVTFKVRAWASAYGSYEEAWLALPGSGGAGASDFFSVDTANPLATPSEDPTPLQWAGMPSFCIFVPEPSTWALACLSALALIGSGAFRSRTRR